MMNKSVEQIKAELAALDRMADVLSKYEGIGATSADWRNLAAWREKLEAKLTEATGGARQ
jgi:hypothetical protein